LFKHSNSNEWGGSDSATGKLCPAGGADEEACRPRPVALKVHCTSSSNWSYVA